MKRVFTTGFISDTGKPSTLAVALSFNITNT